MSTRRLKVWIDLENSPHVLFFEPVIRELRRRGHEVIVTARRFCDTLPLARARAVPVHAIGRGYDAGRSVAIKRCLHVVRCLQLRRFARGQRFDVAASHSSRTQASTAARLGIPTLAATDYEHAHLRNLCRVQRLLVPAIVPVAAFDRAGIPRAVVQQYDGLKEDVYLAGFRPAVDTRRVVGIAEEEILIVFRPSSDNAHYGTDAGRVVEAHLLRHLAAQAGVRILVLPRTAQQRRRLRGLANGRGPIRICERALDGPSLIHAADLVVSGGGTMVREAAVLGVPAISCFTGPLGAVDEFLARQERIRLVRTPEDADCVDAVARRPPAAPVANGTPLQQVVDAICTTGGA